MSRVFLMIAISMLVAIGLMGCGEQQKTVPVGPGVFTVADANTDALALAHIHNAFLREFQARHNLAVLDTMGTNEFLELVKASADAVVEQENLGPHGLTDTDWYKLLDEIRYLRDDAAVLNITGAPVPGDPINPWVFADWLFENEKITLPEYKDLGKLLDDTYWIMKADSLDTPLGKNTAAVRDSSRAFWIERGVVSSSADWTVEGDLGGILIIWADAVGGVAGGLAGLPSGPGSWISGGLVMGATSTLANIMLVPDPPYPYYGPTGGGGSW